MDVIEAIYRRRAVRAYDPRVVEEGTIRDLLRAAVHAPTAHNLQPWLFAIVQNRAQLARYSDRAKRILLEVTSDDPKTQHYLPMLRDPSFNIFYDAGTLIVIGAPPGPFTTADCWLAAEALMLAAHAAGLGTCPIGFALSVLNQDDVKSELGLPPAASAVAPIIVGYPTSTAPEIPRAEPRIVSWSTDGQR